MATKKFLVLFSEKALFMPYMYKSLGSIKAKSKINHELTHQQFDIKNEAEAEGFLYTKKKQYFDHQQELEKQNKGKTGRAIQDFISANGKTQQQDRTENPQPKIISFDWMEQKTGSLTQYDEKKQQVKRTFRQALAVINEEKFLKTSPKKPVEQERKYYSYFWGSESRCLGYYVLNSRNQMVFERVHRHKLASTNQMSLLSYIFLILDCRLNGIENLKVYGYSNLFPFDSQPSLSPQLSKLVMLAKCITETFNSFETEKIAMHPNNYFVNMFNRRQYQ